MATHSSILAWEIPWTEEPGGLQSTGWQKNQMQQETTQQQQSMLMILEYIQSAVGKVVNFLKSI